MKTNIKIGQPHLYFRLKMWFKKYFVNTENFLIVVLTLITIGIAFNAFLKADLTTKLAISTICFLGTTIFFALLNQARRAK